MAKITYGEALGDFGQPTAFFKGSLELTHKEGSKNNYTEIVYTDSKTGSHVIFEGKHLKLDPDTGILFKGQVSEIEFTTKTDGSLLDIKANFNAAKLHDAYTDSHHGGVEGLTSAALAGNDIIQGSTNSDYMFALGGHDDLHGNEGSDLFYGSGADATFTGGADADYFYIAKGYGTETVTDFDPEGDHDLIGVGKGKFTTKFDADAETYTITFSKHDVMTILHVDHELDPATFYHF